MLDKTQEQLLINRIKNGDRDALGEVYIHCKEYFLNYFSNRFPFIKKSEILEDIYHEAIMIFLFNVLSDKLVELRSSICTYITSVGVYHLSNILRRLDRESNTLDELDISEIELLEPLIDPEIINALELELEKYILKLDEFCQKLIRAYYFDKKKIREIARELNIKDPQTVSKRKWLCLDKLKKFFNQ